MSVEVASLSYVLSSVASVGRILESVLSLSKKGGPLNLEEFQKIEAETQEIVSEQMAAGTYVDRKLAASMSREITDVIIK